MEYCDSALTGRARLAGPQIEFRATRGSRDGKETAEVRCVAIPRCAGKQTAQVDHVTIAEDIAVEVGDCSGRGTEYDVVARAGVVDRRVAGPRLDSVRGARQPETLCTGAAIEIFGTGRCKNTVASAAKMYRSI